MNQVVPILVLAVISAVGLVALFITLHAFFTRILERTRSIAAERASRSFLTGFLNTVFFTALLLALAALGQSTGVALFFVLAFLIGLLILLGLVFGITGMVLLLKERLFPGQLGNRPFALAGATATLACLTPYIGWFGLFPYLCFRGLGAFVIALVDIRRERRLAAADEEPDSG